MERIDNNILTKYTEDVKMKSKDALDNKELVNEYFVFQNLLNKFIATGNAYEVANIMKSFNLWNLNKDREPKGFKIQPKDVFYVDLGAFNVKYEESFLHSCLVIKKFGTMVLVVPGSSKKYGKNNFLIEDINAGDGFRDGTGLFIDQIRCVSVTRIKGKKIGQVDDKTFKRVKDKIIEAYFKDIKDELKQSEDNNQLLKKENAALKQEYENLKEEYKMLNQKYYELMDNSE